VALGMPVGVGGLAVLPPLGATVGAAGVTRPLPPQPTRTVTTMARAAARLERRARRLVPVGMPIRAASPSPSGCKNAQRAARHGQGPIFLLRKRTVSNERFELTRRRPPPSSAPARSSGAPRIAGPTIS
jgi:hypothetical protein